MTFWLAANHGLQSKYAAGPEKFAGSGRNLSPRQVAHGDILEPHIPFPAGVQLQGDPSIEGFGLGVGEIDHRDPVEDADHVIAFHLHEHVVPRSEEHTSEL